MELCYLRLKSVVKGLRNFQFFLHFSNLSHRRQPFQLQSKAYPRVTPVLQMSLSSAQGSSTGLCDSLHKQQFSKLSSSELTKLSSYFLPKWLLWGFPLSALSWFSLLFLNSLTNPSKLSGNESVLPRSIPVKRMGLKTDFASLFHPLSQVNPKYLHICRLTSL